MDWWNVFDLAMGMVQTASLIILVVVSVKLWREDREYDRRRQSED
jgi:Na+/alanine symporter